MTEPFSKPWLDMAAPKRPESPALLKTPLRPTSSKSSQDGWEPADPEEKRPQSVRRMVTFCNHLYSRGFLDGIGADIVISAFGRDWNLHRLVLCNSTYFDALFCGGWKESGGTKFVLNFDDENITKDAFGTAIARLYGRLDNLVNEHNVLSLLATATFFDLQDFASDCLEFILGNLNPQTIPTYVTFADAHCYGAYSDRILEGCFTVMCRDGYDTLKECWFRLPPVWSQKILASDAFWAPTEYHRYQFVRDLWLSRKAETRSMLPESGISDDLPEQGPISGGSLEKLSSIAGDVPKLPIRPSIPPPHQADKVPGLQDLSIDDDEQEDYQSADGYDATEEEEAIFRDIFDNRILYTHMTFDQIQTILQDRDPETRVPYVDPRVLHKAIYQQVDLRVRVTGSKVDSETLDAISDNPGYLHPIPKDDRTGGTTGVDVGPVTQFSIFEPFRFSGEFTEVKSLKTNAKKQYRGFFYAGSKWVVYIQKSKSGGAPRLGIYLQRQTHDYSDSEGTGAGEGHTEANTTISTDKLTSSAVAFSSYEDPRTRIQTWFKIFCASRGPSHLLSTFQSTPDSFKLNQSWGWTSKALLADEYLLGEIDGDDISGKLRFSVVMGNI